MFKNREEAGMLLVKKLLSFNKSPATIVLAIPRGGIVVGEKIAKELSLPISVVVVKKLGAPGNPELAIGAVASSGVKYIDWDMTLRSGVEQEYLDKELEGKKKEVEEKVKKFQIPKSKYQKNSKIQISSYKNYILVDDGVATGATTLAAIKYIRSLKPTTHNLQPTTILAVPVIAQETYNKLQPEVNKIVALEVPQFFGAVGEFYKEFPQVSDEEVINILKSLR